MSTAHCRQYCADYHRCIFVVLAFENYKAKHGVSCPLECLAFAEHQIPACLAPLPDKLVPGRDFG